MEMNHETNGQDIKRGHVHEGPRNHYITFAISMVLTLLAFIAVMNVSLSRGFVLVFICALAIIQATLQLLFWMHLKDRGHIFPMIALGLGASIVVAAFITAVYWMWW